MKSFTLLTLLSSIASVGRAAPLPLSKALAEVRKTSLEKKESFHTYQQSQALASAVEGAFDTTLFSSYQKTDDKGQDNSAFSGKERTQSKAELGVRKFLSTGTTFELKATHVENETIFADPNQTSTSQRVNPSAETTYQLMIQQELWRNFMAREVTLQKATTESAGLPAKYQQAIIAQDLQLETEKLYWQCKSLIEQKAFSSRMVAMATEFSAQMEKRVKLGRADSVDVADADAHLVTQESQSLEISIELDKCLNQLALRIDPSGEAQLSAADIIDPLEQNARNPLSRQQSLIKAKKDRYDIKLYQNQQTALGYKQDLAEEMGDPTLSLFALGSQNGLAEETKDSFKEAETARHPMITLGVSLEVSLGQTRSSSEVLAAVEERSALSARQQSTLSQVHKQILVAFSELEGSRKRHDQALKKIKTFARKKRDENIKLKQARSDRVSVIRYEMELLSAEIDRVSSLQRIRTAEAVIRHLTHDYPVSP